MFEFAVFWIFAARRNYQDRGENPENRELKHGPESSVRRIRGAVLGDLLFVPVAHREQHFLGVVQIAAFLAVVLEDARLDDRIHRTGLLAQSAEDAFGEIDVVARGAPGAVGALLGLDRDRKCRANGLAELAGDEALLAVRVAAQGVQPAEARAHRRLLLRKLHRDLAPEEMAPGERHSLHQLDQQEGLEELADLVDHEITICSRASASRLRSRPATRA